MKSLALNQRSVKAAAVVFICVAIAAQMFCAYSNKFIGHADDANNAVLTRNLAQGRGFVVDYVWLFFKDYPGITHNEDEWSVLQPVLALPAYLLFQGSAFGIKFADSLLFICLLVAVYYIARSYFGSLSALFACCFVIISGLYHLSFTPHTDVAFTLFCFMAAWLAVKERYISAGIFSGLAYMQKAYASLLILSIIIFLFLKYKNKKVPLWKIVYYCLCTAVAASPVLIRNYFIFGDPFFTNYRFQAGIIGYGDWDSTYRISLQKAPDFFKTLAIYGPLKVLAKVSMEMRSILRGLCLGEIMPKFLFLFFMAAVFFTEALKKVKPLAQIFLVWFVFVFLFNSFYWHYEARYFYLLLLPVAVVSGNFLFRVIKYCLKSNWHIIVKVMFFALILAVFVLPVTAEVRAQVSYRQASRPFLEMSQWVRDNTDKNDVFMSRNPWEFNFHAERKAVMVPYGAFSDLKFIARKYKVKYLEMDKLSHLREYLYLFNKGSDIAGFEKVYSDPAGGIYIYRIISQ